MQKIKLISVLGLALLMTACGDKTPPAVAVTSVTGTVVEDNTPADEFTLVTKPWTGGAGSVTGQTSVNATPVNLGNLAANGAFTASLPTPAATELSGGMASGSATGCTGQFNVSDTSARVATLSVRVDVSDLGKDGNVAPMTIALQSNLNSAGTGTEALDMQVGVLIYADRAVSFTGTQNCTDTVNGYTYPVTFTAAMNLAQGWNLATYKMVATDNYTAAEVTSSAGTLSMTSGALPTSNWLWLGGNVAPLGVTKANPAAMLEKAQQLLR